MAPKSIRSAARLLAGLTRDRKAATAVEYGLILALIVIALIAGLGNLGSETKATWNGLYTRIATATGF
ncbi:MAG: Flp family type IVb pilin [Sphingomonadales bacterium]|nr:Flp family type IVb pilin [Sphingomonadales bacterium]